MMRNEADLQLLLYAHLLREPGKPWPHTAYFILEEGKMIARNREAFRQAVEAAPGVNHGEVMDRMLAVLEKTVQWRLEQVKNGQLELRNASTAPLLDALYAESLMDVLEMKNEEDKYDDYKVLLREAVG
jgi:ATP-dependent helicase/nuclease subunit B